MCITGPTALPVDRKWRVARSTGEMKSF